MTDGSPWEWFVFLTGQQPLTMTWLPVLAFACLIGCGVELSAGRPLSRLLPTSWTSVRTDLWLWLAGRLFGLIQGLGLPVLTLALASEWLGDPNGPSPGVLAWVLLGTVHLLFTDFVSWVLHWARHRIDVLWAFHVVHHSATYLQPFTTFRRHPFEAHVLVYLLNTVGSLPLVGIVWLYPGVDPLRLTVFAVVQTVFLLTYANLLHSMVWLSFGPVVENWLVSPAMHQIHHSRKEDECMSNYGQIFSIWDRLFGTLIRAHQVPFETLELGVDGVEHDTLWQVFVSPVLSSARALRGWVRGPA